MLGHWATKVGHCASTYDVARVSTELAYVANVGKCAQRVASSGNGAFPLLPIVPLGVAEQVCVKNNLRHFVSLFLFSSSLNFALISSFYFPIWPHGPFLPSHLCFHLRRIEFFATVLLSFPLLSYMVFSWRGSAHPVKLTRFVPARIVNTLIYLSPRAGWPDPKLDKNVLALIGI